MAQRATLESAWRKLRDDRILMAGMKTVATRLFPQKRTVVHCYEEHPKFRVKYRFRISIWYWSKGGHAWTHHDPGTDLYKSNDLMDIKEKFKGVCDLVRLGRIKAGM